ncbi:hypothetical protein L211DRAFT_846900 [Terfezia boudieri ATCC MYA-4762]|uniref:Zn(2)-C6 fungal-type domain-containing protein n=1 Tax=Terfezia boudieri ATCC MYA-4762 TaxID=1051890 RepID=A0A3N4LUZ2_9PEZI|nr:hypothetical protein L211DRAFT_846900 [Terfezia boudieri ATCC MYA-4762]
MSTNNSNTNPGGLSVNRERSHGRTLSVPSLSSSEPHGRSPSPSPSIPARMEGLSQSGNMYLTPNAEGMSQWSGLRPGSSGGGVRSRSASLSNPMVAGQVPKKKVVTACQRCRTRKIKCDGVLPCCGNCAKAAQPCMEVDKSGERDIPRSHILELENRIKYLESLLAQNCPNIDLDTIGPPVELRSRPAPPSIRIVTSGSSLQPRFSLSINSSPPISAASTPASFDFSFEPCGSSLMPPYSPAFSPFSLSEPPGSGIPSPMLSPSSPFLGQDYGGTSPGGQSHAGFGEAREGRKGSFASVKSESASSVCGNPTAQDVGLVTLGLTEDSSRYIGASSGYEFARMMFADWPAPEPAGPSIKEEGGLSMRRRSTGSIGSNSSNKVQDSGSATPCQPTNAQPKSRPSSAAVGDSPERKRGRWTDVKKSSPLPSLEDGNRFASAFFDSVHPHYPFLERNAFEVCREVVYSSEKGVTATFTALKRASSIPILPPSYTLPLARFHVFMVFAVGSSVISAQQGQRPTADSDGYFISAMAHVEHDEVNLRGSLQGLQNLLLIAMYALHVDGGGGMSIWHLNSTVVAGCIELGLHKNSVVTMAGNGKLGAIGADSALVALRRKVFWSIYALDRNLGIMLGRPFALDENECDVELPDNLLDDRPGSGLMDRLSVQGGHSPGGPQKGESADVLIGTSSFPGTVYLLQMTRITSVIKSTLYRISPIKPTAYPTPHWLHNLQAASQFPPYIEDIAEWQRAIHGYLAEIRKLSKAVAGTLTHHSNAHYATCQAIELKYHEAMQLLYRPNAVIPQPNIQNALTCLGSTVEMIRTYARLKKNGGMIHAWLSAQWVFLAGLSMMWSFKTSWPVILQAKELDILREDVKTCSALLEEFGTRWKVMLRARERFDGVAKFTLESLANQLADIALVQPPPSPLAGVTLSSQQLLNPSCGKQRMVIAPQRNLLVDCQNTECTGRLQQEQQLRQQQPRQQRFQQQQHQQRQQQQQQQRDFNNIQGLDSLFVDRDKNSPYSDQSQLSTISSQPTDNSVSADRLLLNQPLVIPIIRQSPTPTSETPTPLNPNPVYLQQSDEWSSFGNSSEAPSSLLSLQQQAVEDMDLSFIMDMDWTSPEFSGYTLDGLGGITGGLLFDSGPMNEGNRATGSGGETEGDSKMWEMGGSSAER